MGTKVSKTSFFGAFSGRSCWKVSVVLLVNHPMIWW